MSFRILLVPLLVASLGAPAVAAPARPSLGGTVRISGSHTTVMEVRLPKAVDISSFEAPKGSSINGDGRIVGIMLLDPKLGLRAVSYLRYGLCTTAGCRSPLARTWFLARGDGGPTGPGVKVPAGDYRLVLVTDGRPVSVVLKLPGLKGTTTLRPSRQVAVKHATLDFSAMTTPPLQTMYSASTGWDVDGGVGIVLHQFTAMTDVSLEQQGGFCLYERDVPILPAPGCPTGQGADISFTRVELGPDRWSLIGTIRYLQEGAFRGGPYFRTVGTARDPLGTVTTLTLPRG